MAPPFDASFVKEALKIFPLEAILQEILPEPVQCVKITLAKKGEKHVIETPQGLYGRQFGSHEMVYINQPLVRCIPLDESAPIVVSPQSAFSTLSQLSDELISYKFNDINSSNTFHDMFRRCVIY